MFIVNIYKVRPFLIVWVKHFDLKYLSTSFLTEKASLGY